jgi:hypothetical protein
MYTGEMHGIRYVVDTTGKYKKMYEIFYSYGDMGLYDLNIDIPNGSAIFRKTMAGKNDLLGSYVSIFYKNIPNVRKAWYSGTIIGSEVDVEGLRHLINYDVEDGEEIDKHWIYLSDFLWETKEKVAHSEDTEKTLTTEYREKYSIVYEQLGRYFTDSFIESIISICMKMEHKHKQLRMIVSNLNKNEELRNKILCGHIKATDLSMMTSNDMRTAEQHSDAQLKKQQELDLYIKYGKDVYVPRMENKSHASIL